MAKKLIKWKWTYHHHPDTEEEGFSAKGSLWTKRKPNQDGFFQIKKIKGIHKECPAKQCREKISSLVPAGSSIPGNTGYPGDNLIRPINKRKQSLKQLTGSGFQYELHTETYVNVFYKTDITPESYREFHARQPFPEGITGNNTEVDIIFNATPLQ